MQSLSLNACAGYETKIWPTPRASWQTLWQASLIANWQLLRNFLIVITTSIFDSALEPERSKRYRFSQICARNTECFRNQQGIRLNGCDS